MHTTLFALAALLATTLAPEAAAQQQQRKPAAAKAKATPKAAPKHAAKPAARNWVNVVVRTPQGGYRMGNPNAALKLVEYGSRTCPTCGRFAAEGMTPLRDKYVRSGKLSFEYRDFLIHGAPDFALALLNQCVPAPRFFVVLDALYANQPQFLDRLEAAQRDQPQLLERYQTAPSGEAARGFAELMGAVPFMRRHGLTPAAARQCLTNRGMIAGIAKTYADGANIHHVQGTPSFFLNGRRLDAYSWGGIEPQLIAAGG